MPPFSEAPKRTVGRGPYACWGQHRRRPWPVPAPSLPHAPFADRDCDPSLLPRSCLVEVGWAWLPAAPPPAWASPEGFVCLALLVEAEGSLTCPSRGLAQRHQADPSGAFFGVGWVVGADPGGPCMFPEHPAPGLLGGCSPRWGTLVPPGAGVMLLSAGRGLLVCFFRASIVPHPDGFILRDTLSLCWGLGAGGNYSN